jgi:hypothetical protein
MVQWLRILILDVRSTYSLDWVEDRFYEGKKIEDRVDRVVRLGICTMKHETFHGSGYYISTSIKLISITSILHKYYYYINTVLHYDI